MDHVVYPEAKSNEFEKLPDGPTCFLFIAKKTALQHFRVIENGHLE